MRLNTDPEWLKQAAEREDGCIVSVGGLVTDLERADRLARLEAENRELRDALQPFARWAAAGGGGEMSEAIYTASRVRHAAKWLEARATGVQVISTWIDEAGEGQSVSMVDLWRRCVDEARSADALILYRQDDEPLKGALIEAGAALGAGKPVFAVGFDGPNDLKTFSFLNHPLVVRCETLDQALAAVRATTAPASPAAP